MHSGMTQPTQRQEIPTHLEVEDRILFGLTLRQGVVVLVGLSVGYSLYVQMENLPWPAAGAGVHPPLALRVLVALLPALLALVLAAFQPAGRPLEEWLFALARYAMLPKHCVWRTRATLDKSPEGPSDPDGDEADAELFDVFTTPRGRHLVGLLAAQHDQTSPTGVAQSLTDVECHLPADSPKRAERTWEWKLEGGDDK